MTKRKTGTPARAPAQKSVAVNLVWKEMPVKHTDGRIFVVYMAAPSRSLTFQVEPHINGDDATWFPVVNIGYIGDGLIFQPVALSEAKKTSEEARSICQRWLTAMLESMEVKTGV